MGDFKLRIQVPDLEYATAAARNTAVTYLDKEFTKHSIAGSIVAFDEVVATDPASDTHTISKKIDANSKDYTVASVVAEVELE